MEPFSVLAHQPINKRIVLPRGSSNIMEFTFLVSQDVAIIADQPFGPSPHIKLVYMFSGPLGEMDVYDLQSIKIVK